MADKKLNVLLYFPMPKKQWAVPQTIINSLKEEFKDVDFIFADNEDVFDSNIANADILFSPIFDDNWLNKAKNLKWYHSSSIQFVINPLPNLFSSDVQVTNSRGAHQTSVSEVAIGSALSFLHSMQASKMFTHGETFTKSLDGLTVGIFGLGENGTATALRANLLGARVIAIKRSMVEDPPFAEWVKDPKYLLGLVKESDIIVITSPLTKETEKLFTSEVFDKCKNGVVVVNLGRPSIVDEESIIQALESGKVYGYVVDSLLTQSSKLYTHDRVLIVPHISPSHKDFWKGPFNIFADNLNRFINEDPLRNQFNKELLY